MDIFVLVGNSYEIHEVTNRANPKCDEDFFQP